MTTYRALALGILGALVLALLAPVLGDNGGAGYSEVVQPGLLFLASVLSLRVSFMYRSLMRRLFTFLAVFLFLFGLVTVTSLVDEVAMALDDNFLRALLGYQVITYAFLILALFVGVRVSGLGKVGSRGRIALIIFLILAVVIVARSFPTFQDLADSSGEAAAIYLVIRVLDVLAMVLVAPALILFAQNARAKHQESLSFSVIGIGIITSLVLVYIYELLSGDSLSDIAFRDYQTGSLLDALYIFGYSTLAVGIFVHWQHQEWSMRRVEQILGFDGDDDPS